MENETILILDASTGEEVVRELTPEEIVEREELQAQWEAQQAEQEKRAAARTSALAKLADLGLTAEEVAAL